jgi:cytochrome b involved in lipid metabolism
MSDALESGPTPSTGTYSLEEVSKHNIATDLWIVVNQEVYDLSEFVNEHPGGTKSEI